MIDFAEQQQRAHRTIDAWPEYKKASIIRDGKVTPLHSFGHEPDEPERYDSLIRRYSENPVGLVAELAKKNHERKLMHEMLSAYGIRETTSENRELCLVARLAIALEELGNQQ